jgi:hypothetical protein
MEFARPAGLPEIVLHPRPWAESHPCYYLTYRFEDPDGHGGYTRENRFDTAGVPFTLENGRPRYDPLVVARYAMRMLGIGATSESQRPVAQARLQLEPLLVSGENTGAWGRGDAPASMSTEHPSCLVQGVVISALLRLHDGVPCERTSRVIERAFERLAAPIEEGGTRSRLEEGPFLEEYPSLPPSSVLNGCLYALFALYDLADVLRHTAALELARSIEGTLSRAVVRFDAGMGWSRYALDLNGAAPIASLHYHRIHILGLRLVALRTGNEALEHQAERWERAMASRRVRARVAVAKVAQTLSRRRRAIG